MRPFYRVISFCLLFHLPSRAQLAPAVEHEIDSLKNVIRTESRDTIKIHAYMRWDDLIYLSDQKLDEELNRKIISIAENGLKKPGLSKKEQLSLKAALNFSLNGLAVIYLNQGDLNKSLAYQNKSLRIAEETGNKNGMINSLNNLGAMYERKGDCPKAIEYYTRCMKLCEETGNESGLALELNNIGVIYVDQEDWKSAMDYARRSLKIRQKLHDEPGIALSMNNIGSAFHSMRQMDSALYYFKLSLDIRQKMGVDKDAIATSLNNIGAIYQEKGDYQQALPYFMQSLEQMKDFENSHQMAMTLNNIGNTYFSMGDYEKAFQYNNKAFIVAKKSSSGIMIKDAALSLYKCYEKKGKYREALEMHELFIEMRDSVQNDEKKKAVMRQEMAYTYEKQKALDEKEHEKQIALTDEKKNRDQVIAYAAAGGLVLVLVFSFFVFKRLRITSQQKDIIEQQKNVVEEKQKEILDSIAYAKRLQQAILPHDKVVKKHLPGSFILYRPKDIVAGDFYWMEVVSLESVASSLEKDPKFSSVSELRTADSQLILLAAADCTGHGVPGAMVSVVCSNALNRAAIEFRITDPGKILDKARELVLETFSKSGNDVKDGMDISLVSINKETLEVKWAGANNPLWIIRDGIMTEIRADKQSIGRTEHPKDFTTHTLKMKKGDWIFLFTDGYADQFGLSAGTRAKLEAIIHDPKSSAEQISSAKATLTNGKKFKYKPLQELLRAHADDSAQTQLNTLQEAFSDWKGTLEQVDDICIIGVRL